MPGFNFFDKKEVEWADFSLSFSGATMGKVRGLTVDIELDMEHLHAAGNQPISIQGGNEKVSGMLKCLKGALDDIWMAAVAAGARNPLYIEVDLIGSFVKNGTRGVWKCVIPGVRISKVTYNMMQGDKFMDCELPFLALDMKVTAA